MRYRYKTGVLVPFVQKYYKVLVAAVAAIFLLSLASMTLNVSATTINVTPSNNTPPQLSNIVLNDQSVNLSNIRSANCQAITNFYPVSGEIDLSATITDDASDVANARYRVRKVNPNGCSNTTIFSSGFTNMMRFSDSNTWEDMPGFDTTTIPEDGQYTIMLVSSDTNGNTVTRYIDILVDNYVDNKDECKNGGWERGVFGQSFKNQGQCVSHFVSNGTSTAARNKNR